MRVTKIQKYKKTTKRQKFKNKKTKRQKGKKTKRQKDKKDFCRVMSGQFCNLAIFLEKLSGNTLHDKEGWNIRDIWLPLVVMC